MEIVYIMHSKLMHSNVYTHKLLFKLYTRLLIGIVMFLTVSKVESMGTLLGEGAVIFIVASQIKGPTHIVQTCWSEYLVAG